MKPTIIEGDILQKNNSFYRVANSSNKDIVVNKILFNPKTNRFQIYHGYTYVDWNQIDDGIYILLNDTNRMERIEILRRRYKLELIKASK